MTNRDTPHSPAVSHGPAETDPTSGVTLRPFGEHDIPRLVDFRVEMFRDMGWTDEARLDELRPRYGDYVADHLRSGEFAGWVAEYHGEVVGAVAVLWERVPPTVRNLSGVQAYLLGLYVVPAHRRRGIARRLAERAIEYAKAEGAEVMALHASPEARPLYEGLGFAQAPELRMFTDPSSAAWSPREER